MPALARAVGMPELTDDARFARPEARAGNARLLISLLDEAFARRPLAEWRAILDAAGLTFGVVGTVAEIATDPQALANGMLRPLAETGMMTVDSPFTLSEAEKVTVELAPSHGEHSRAILLEAGYSETEIAALRAAGTIVDE
jgi:crotonobetainyl-CoA:carnitine CoA-transferase CaiB-like acyl-CoA transferase